MTLHLLPASYNDLCTRTFICITFSVAATSPSVARTGSRLAGQAESKNQPQQHDTVPIYLHFPQTECRFHFRFHVRPSPLRLRNRHFLIII